MLAMTSKEILHEILKGMCPYMSTGVPEIYWKLAVKMTRGIYGSKGVKLLKQYRSTCDDSVEVDTEIISFTIDGWEDGGNTHIGPKEVIKKLEAL